MTRFRSLSAQLIVIMVATMSIALAVLVGLTIARVERSLSDQAFELGRLSAQKLGDELTAEAKLARYRLDTLMRDTARRLGVVAQRADIGRAVQSRNTVAISETLDPAGRAANIDVIIALDPKFRVIGATSKLESSSSTPHSRQAPFCRRSRRRSQTMSGTSRIRFSP